MEWLKSILTEVKITDGVLDVDGTMEKIKKEFPLHAIPKSVFNTTNDKLKEATKTIEDLKKSNKDNEELQKTIDSHKQTIKDLEDTHKKELTAFKKNEAIKDVLAKNNAKHSDLLASKFDLDKIIVNEDGTVTGLQEQFETVSKDYADMFDVKNDKKNPYEYIPKDDKSDGESSDGFLDIIKENQVKR